MAENTHKAPEADTEPEHRNAIRHYWEVMWAWLGKPVVQQRSVYLLIVIFMFYLPLPYFGRVVQDWFWDRGLFFDPKHEGAIIVESPQLFTRERLINQRLEDSRWIDGRIALVDKMIAKHRFGLPDEVREDFLTRRLEFLAQVSDGNGAQQEGAQQEPEAQQETERDQDSKSSPAINVSPHLEFRDAHEYRQFLVQTKYEYILDDVHDTHSNTLHRLNFNLLVSPSRSYSSSIAAVSVRLQQPTDPQWLLHKYGALLLDIREELSETAQKLIQDRETILQENSSSGFPAEIDVLLFRLVTENVGDRDDAQRYIEQARDLHQQDTINALSADFRRSLRELAPGTDLGLILADYFSQRPQRRDGNDTVAEAPTERETLANSNSLMRSDAEPQQPRNRGASYERHPMDSALDTLLSQCGQHVELINLLPASFFSSDTIEFRKLKDEIREKWSVLFPEGGEAHTGSDLDVTLRRVLYNSPIKSAPCSSRASGSIAMLGALGRSVMTNRLPERANECFPELEESVQEYSQKVPNQDREFLSRFCPGLRKQLVNVGIVHLVKEDLLNTPIDTVGRVRTLSDYFHLDVKDCSLISCKIRVMTIAEKTRDQLLESKGLVNTADLESADLTQLQKIGENEALRLFAELSCFSNARSYTVYPRKGAGRNVYHTQTEQNSLWSWLGGSSVSVSEGTTRSQHGRHNSIFGIGDTGDDHRDKELECGPSFLRVLNNLKPTDDVVEKLTKVLNANSDGYDDRWLATVRCLLHVETRAPRNLTKAREQCHDGTPESDGIAPVFDIYHLTSVVRHLRQRETTLSWIVAPLDGEGHELKSQPVSTLVSIPSWWPGVEVVIETCWVRPRWIGNDTSKGLCQDTPKRNSSEPLAVFDTHINRAKARGRIESSQILPLPHDLDDVLPKLGFFIVRYPYLDNFEANNVSLETGRKVQLRLTGKRLWKNPRVRLGEQWHSEVQVLPDMQGIVATFECLDPIRRPGRVMVDERHLYHNSKKRDTSADDMLFWAETRPDTDADELYTELRQVQVWTSEGATNPANLQVSSFRPVETEDPVVDQPCWRIGKPISDEDLSLRR